MMLEASFSAAAAAAISTSSTALSVAVTGAGSPPWLCPGFYDLTKGQVPVSGLTQAIRAGRQSCHPPGHPGSGLVELALADVLDDAVWHQVPDGVTGADPGAALGRGDGQRGNLDEADPLVRQSAEGQPVTGPGAADEMRQLEQLVGVAPGDHPGQRVGPGDEEELGVGPALGAQIAQGIDGVGLAGPVDVDPADGEPGVGCGRDHRHEVTVLGRGDIAAVLLPGLAGRHEDDLVQREEVRDLAGRR